MHRWGFPGGSPVMNLPANAGALGSSPGLGRSPGEGNGNLLQYSCLGNPMDRGAWWAVVHGAARVRNDLVTKAPPPPDTYHLKVDILSLNTWGFYFYFFNF